MQLPYIQRGDGKLLGHLRLFNIVVVKIEGHFEEPEVAFNVLLDVDLIVVPNVQNDLFGGLRTTAFLNGIYA